MTNETRAETVRLLRDPATGRFLPGSFERVRARCWGCWCLAAVLALVIAAGAGVAVVYPWTAIHWLERR